MNKKILIFAVFGMFLFSLALVSSSVYVNDPTSCPSAPYQSQSPVTPGELVCGYDSGIVYWYNMSTLTAPSGNTTVDSTNYADVDGGYVLDCEAKDSVAPFCDNSGSFWCDRDSACYSVNRQTTCVGTASGGGFGVSACSTCRSGFNYCDGSFTDADGCEIETGVTTFSTNSVYNSTCGAVCSSGYLDINGDGTGSDGDGCEIQVGASCTIGALSGTYDGSGVCVASKSNFTTGTEIAYNSSVPLLWGDQYGTGDLINFTNKITNESFAVNNTGCIIFPDGSTQCEAGSGSWTESGSDIYYNSGNVGVGTTNPSYPLHINSSNSFLSVFNGTTAGEYLIGLFNTVRNWALGVTSNGFFTIKDSTSNNYPFTIENGSKNNSLYIDNQGFVGINTSSPKNTLNVLGEGNFTGDVTTQADFCITGGSCLSTSLQTGDSPPWKVVLGQIQPKNFNNTVGINSTDSYATLTVGGTGLFNDTLFVYNLSAPASQHLQFQTNETTRMFINYTSGNLGINTVDPQNKLNVVGDANITTNLEVGGQIDSTGAIDTDAYFSYQGQVGITNSASYWLCTDAGCTTSCQVQINGGVITNCI